MLFRSEQARLAKAHENFQSGQKVVGGYTLSQTIEKARERLEAEGKKLTPEDVRVIQRRFEGAAPDAGSNAGIKTLPSAQPPVAPPTAAPATAPMNTATTAPANTAADMLNKALSQPGYKPTEPKSIEALMQEDRQAAEKVPTTPEALALLKHYNDMAERYKANDQEEKAQQAINARNNLWTFLSNTRGSSLGAAAGKANAALQPLLSAQETRRQSYQKQRDEQEMLLGKARYEIAQAEQIGRAHV